MPSRIYRYIVDRQPAEQLWLAMKRSAASEKGEITSKQAVDRIRAIVYKEAGTKLPDDALRFYAEEYQAMVRGARKR